MRKSLHLGAWLLHKRRVLTAIRSVGWGRVSWGTCRVHRVGWGRVGWVTCRVHRVGWGTDGMNVWIPLHSNARKTGYKSVTHLNSTCSTITNIEYYFKKIQEASFNCIDLLRLGYNYTFLTRPHLCSCFHLSTNHAFLKLCISIKYLMKDKSDSQLFGMSFSQLVGQSVS